LTMKYLPFLYVGIAAMALVAISSESLSLTHFSFNIIQWSSSQRKEAEWLSSKMLNKNTSTGNETVIDSATISTSNQQEEKGFYNETNLKINSNDIREASSFVHVDILIHPLWGNAYN
jgi:hypothetical protein